MTSPRPTPGQHGTLTLSELLHVPARVHPPFTPASLGASPHGWATLLRDGDIVEVRPGFAVVPGTQITAELRARSLWEVTPRGVVVGRASAAWVHTGHGAGRRICVLYAPRGHRPRDVHRLEACQATVRPWEISTFHLDATALHPEDAAQPVAAQQRTLAVTTLVRTAMDVATWCDPVTAANLLDHLLAAGLDPDEALHRLDLVASWRGAEGARTLLLAARRRARAGGGANDCARPASAPTAPGLLGQTRSSGFVPVMR